MTNPKVKVDIAIVKPGVAAVTGGTQLEPGLIERYRGKCKFQRMACRKHCFV